MLSALIMSVAVSLPQEPVLQVPPQGNIPQGPWPKLVQFPGNMVAYKRGTMTQAIAVTNDRDTIDPVPRRELPDKRWHQSGGMLGVDDFRSDLYRYLPRDPWVWIGDISVNNGLKHRDFDGQLVDTFQTNRGLKVEYPNGSRFMDVLSTKGAVFEIRQFEKVDGAWEPSVLFKDVAARPKGYTGLTVSCASCHSKAGTGGYAVGLVPGGDNVLSTGFTRLEGR